MKMVTRERRAEVAKVAQMIRRWAASRSDVRTVAIVGSWARDRATMDSDLDVVVLSDDKLEYVTLDDWIEDAVGERATPAGQGSGGHS